MRVKNRVALWIGSALILALTALTHAQGAERLDALEEQATALQNLSTETFSNGKATKDSRQILNEVVSQFTVDELKQIKEQGESAVPQSKAKIWHDLRARYLEIEGSQDRLIDAFDEMANAEVDFLTDYGVSVVQKSHQEIRASLSPKDAKRFDDRLELLKTQHEKYQASKKYFGTPKDVVRRDSLMAAITAFRDYYEELDRLTGPKQSLSTKVAGTVRQTLEALKSIFEKMRTLAAVLPDGVRTLKAVFFPTEKIEPGKLDFTKNLYQTVKSYTKAQGILVDIQGRENIPPAAAPAGKVLNIFTPSHRHALNDLALMAHYTPEDTLIFAALTSFLPKPLVAPVAKNPAMIAVGKKQDPIKALVERLKENRSRDILIYPEGGLPTGIEDSTPIRGKFSSGLIEKLVSEGYDIRFIPVTYLDSSRFLNKGEIFPKNAKLTARVSEPIDPHTYLAMRAIGKDDRSISRFIRSTWFENFPSDSDHVLGLLRPKAVVAESSRYLTRGKGETSPCYPILNQALQDLK